MVYSLIPTTTLTHILQNNIKLISKEGTIFSHWNYFEIRDIKELNTYKCIVDSEDMPKITNNTHNVNWTYFTDGEFKKGSNKINFHGALKLSDKYTIYKDTYKGDYSIEDFLKLVEFNHKNTIHSNNNSVWIEIESPIFDSINNQIKSSIEKISGKKFSN